LIWHLCFFSPVAFADAASAPQILLFTPQGAVKGVRQVTARFSEPMVPLGDPRSIVDPFTITCPESGAARWADSVNWIYDFSRDLPAGVRCIFRLHSDLKSLAGKALAGQQEFSFSTGGPAVMSHAPYERIEEDQAFVLFLDAEATEASVLEHVSFSVEGLPERVGIQVVSGDAREAILKTLYSEQRKGPLIVLQARQRFPNTAKVTLVWGAGVTSTSGVSTTQDQTLTFQVREVFKADFHCERENKKADCIPLRPLNIHFSAPISRTSAQQFVLVGPQGKRWKPEPGYENQEFVSGVSFKGPFPEEATLQIELPPGVTDEAGRALINADNFPLTVKTGPFPPLAKFAARFGIVEWKADPTLPVTIRNLEAETLVRSLRADSKEPPAGLTEQVREYWKRLQARWWRIPPDRPEDVLPWLRRVATAKRDVSVFSGQTESRSPNTLTLPQPTRAQSFEVVGIPFDAPGLYVVEIESMRLGRSLLDKAQPMFVPTAALVTNLSVHFKWGRETSLVWVTTLDTGKPAADAWVTVQNCLGKILWKGQTDAQGLVRFGPLPTAESLPFCEWADDAFTNFHDFSQIGALESLTRGVLVTAQTGDDLSFVHSSWNDGIELWRFQLPFEEYGAPLTAHTIFDRSLFRAGETVSMKHLLRERTSRGFSLVTAAERPMALSIRHLGSDERYEFPLQWDATGGAESAWRIPQEAKLGRYDVVLVRRGGNEEELVGPLPAGEDRRMLPPLPEQEWVGGNFRVEEFRVPLMKAVLQTPAEALVAAAEAPVDISVQYLAGGGAGKLPITLRSQIREKTVPASEGFTDFVFVNGGVKEGVTRYGGGEDEETSMTERGGMPAIHQRATATLDEAGTTRLVISNLPRSSAAQEALAELEFRDPNGQVQTVARTVPLWPAKLLVGVKPESWARTRDKLVVQAAVIDIAGQPVSGAQVRVEIFERKTYSHRKRLVGGFYAYDNVAEVKRIGEFCQGVTATTGLLRCEGKPPASGNLIVLASVQDDAGNLSVAHRDVWVTGAEEWWFDGHESDRIDVLPEQRRYEPGETARLQVRTPFREATALVAVERDGGVLHTSIVNLSGKEPVVEVPIEENYAPNVFVSVLVVRGRVGDVQPTALVDLGKPAFKLGVAELRVGWKMHELTVTLAAEREVYRVREKAAVKISVRSSTGQILPTGSEVALAAVDAGLLELAPNASWNVLDAMMGRRTYGIQTATAQMQVVGKRHYGLKALPQGGGGGRQATRELFDTLLLWRGRVVLDERGEASVEIPLNDSLTSFRIVAVATAGVSQFGTGATTIRTTQDLMVFPGLPPVVREGDRFRAEVTVRNTTSRTMDVTVSGLVTDPIGPLAVQTLELTAGEAKVLGWDVVAPIGVENLQYDITVSGTDGAFDRVRATQQVQAAAPVRILQATLLRWEKDVQLPVERPQDALPDRGGVQLGLSPTLLAGVEGVREWMRRYPYSCLEQQISRAVALHDEQLWQKVMASLPSHVDTDGLLKYFPTMEYGSEVLTAYVLAISHEAGWTLPDEVQERMLAGLRGFVGGSIVRSVRVRAVDLSLRKLAALEALVRYGRADPQLLSTIVIEPNLWPTATVLDWWSLLLQLPDISDREARLREVEHILRARLNFQGTTMGFSTERSDNLWWLMESTDTNAVRLLLHLLRHNLWKADAPRVARGAIGRQQRGAWDLTVANAWGVLAVEKFSQVFESIPVTGVTTAKLADVEQQAQWARSPRGAMLSFAWPQQRAELFVTHAGDGQPWITVQSRAALPLTAPLASGYHIMKTLTPVEARETGRWSRGDIIRVKLEIDAQSDMTWVVINDPIPTGAAHLGGGLARDSQLATQGTQAADALWPAFEERAFSAYRSYYEFVPKGRFVAEYTMRLNQSGTFHLPPTRVEALYAPEMFGELPNTSIEVQQ
jgi:hypothetical protein